ncbi:MAG: ribonuclease HII [Chloroflexi bacterium]|nr:ribonuclease HII [Chloroflexota bacterium]
MPPRKKEEGRRKRGTAEQALLPSSSFLLPERPDLTFEQRFLAAGHTLIAGLDEAGRGAWAGPVVAAAVILPLDRPDLPALLEGVNDSKQLSPLQREAAFERIRRVALAVGVGGAGPGEVDRDGLIQATRAAMLRALAALQSAPQALLLDHLTLPTVVLPQTALVKGDARSLSIAAASIVAKVSRDRAMAALERFHPGYGFAAHKGYGTPAHRAALARLGVSEVHRRSYRPVAASLRPPDR